MKKISDFIKTTLLGGFTIVLPIAVLLGIASWLVKLLGGMLDPIANFIFGSESDNGFFAKTIVFIIIIAVCFAIGYAIKTSLGNHLFNFFEENVLNRIPGYKTIKDIIDQFFGDKKSPFSTVAMVKPFGNDTLMTGFITEKHDNGTCTVFIPTGPNPTSGNIYHVKNEDVIEVDADLEHTMKSIIACGAGTHEVMKKMEEQ